jgi:hypothetical protein
MKALRQHIKPGHVYRRSDLEYYSSAIDRHLVMLTKDESLVKLSQGLYYAPKSSKFGPVPPDDALLVESFLKDSDFLIIKPNMYNALGLGKGEFKFNGKTFEFKIKSSFPNQLTKEFLLVDLLNNLNELAEDQYQTTTSLSKNLSRFNNDELMRIAQQYGSSNSKKLLKSIYRKKKKHA